MKSSSVKFHQLATGKRETHGKARRGLPAMDQKNEEPLFSRMASLLRKENRNRDVDTGTQAN